MTHDPLCPTKVVYDITSSQLVATIYDELQCQCDVIARVREDERMRDDDYAYVATQSHADGYAAALRDVLQALESERTDGFRWWHKPWNNALSSAAISIRALGVER